MVDIVDIANEKIAKQTEQIINDFYSKQKNKKSARETCLECGDDIPVARQKAIKGCQYCINCQENLEK